MNSNEKKHARKELSEKSALTLLIVIAFVWGAGFFVTDVALRTFTTFQILTVRFLIGSSILSIVFKDKLKTFSRVDIIGGIVSGFLLAISFGIQVYGQYYSTPSVSAFITVAYVVLIPIFAKFIFKKSISKSVVFSAILIFAGIFVLTLGTFNVNTVARNMNLGIFLTAICAVTYAFEVLAVDYYCNSGKFQADPTNLTISMLWTAFFVSLFFQLISMFVFNEKATFTDTNETIKSVISVIFLGVFSTAFAFLGQNFAQKYTSASKVAIILSLESVFGAILSAIVLKEKFNLTMIIGFVIVFCAVLITELSSTNNNGGDKDNEND